MVLDVLQPLQHRRVVGERHLVGLEARLAVRLRVVAQALDRMTSFDRCHGLSILVTTLLGQLGLLAFAAVDRALGGDSVIVTGA